MKAESETWSDTAFEEGLARVAGVDTIYFLSDGQPYRDGKHLGLRNVADSVKTLNRFVKSRVHTIGFRQAGDNLQNFLKVLALENDGTYTALE